MKQTIIYLRTSTEEQNPENQKKDCLSLIKSEAYEIFEEKQSAFKDNSRKQFELIREGIKKGEIKELIVWDWDRLFRNRKKLKEFFEFCKIYKCEIHSFRQKFFEDFYKIPSPFDEIIQELVLNLMGWLAEDESKKKSERIKSAIRKDKKGHTISYKGNVWGRKAISEKANKEIIEARKKGLSIREISQSVFYWDKNKNRKKVSVGYVQKTLKENGL